MEPAALLARCQQGDPLAWEHLVRSTQSQVYAVAYATVGDAEEARDLTQEIYLRVYRKLDACREPERFLGWLLRVARNVSLDHRRRLRARPPRQDLAAEALTDLADPSPDPAARWRETSRRLLVEQALAALSPLSREMILLKDVQGLRLEEIADALDLPLGTVKSRSHRARLELARALGALGGPPAEAAGL